MQIKTCQDCDQLRPFTVKRTCPAKNRANSDIIESFFQEDPCMDLASRLIWRCFIETPSNEGVRKSKFCQIIWVTFITLWFHEFFQLLSILSSSKILCRFFCQIIMGSPLNSNVPDRRSVPWSHIATFWGLKDLCANCWSFDSFDIETLENLDTVFPHIRPSLE